MLTLTESKILSGEDPLSCRIRETMKLVLGEMAKEKAMDDVEDGPSEENDEAYLREIRQVKQFIWKLAHCAPVVSSCQNQNG